MVGAVSGPGEDTMRRRILVVDDNSALASAIARLLQDEYEVRVCTNGLTALEQVIADGPFDALLVDVRMPAIDGLHLRTALLEASPEHARRMVFVTGADLDPAEASALQGRIVLRKPVGAVDLRLAIQRVIAATCVTPPAMAAVRSAPSPHPSPATIPAPPHAEARREAFASASFEEVPPPADPRDSRRD